VPLLILLAFAALSAILSYIILMVAGDILTMRKMVSKGAQIFLLLSIFQFRKYLRLSWAEIGFAPKAIFLKQLGWGLGLGLITLAPVMITLYYFDISVIDQTRLWTMDKVTIRSALALLLALLISIAEEPLFTGLLLASFRQKMSDRLAVILTASYYASFHFIKTKTDIPYQDLDITSGFKLMAEAFSNILNPDIISALIALFIVGVFLATIRTQVASSIGICIGCHTAWVWQIKMGKDFFNINPKSDYYYLVSSYYDGVVGPLVSIWLSLLIAGYFIRCAVKLRPSGRRYKARISNRS